MKCLTDGAIMKEERAYGVLVDICPTCGAAWFSAEEFSRVVDMFVGGLEHDNAKLWRSEVLSRAPEKVLLHWQEEEERTCPVDYGPMMKSVYAGDSGVNIDRCNSCLGIWLDGGELARVWAYVKPGSKDEAIGKFLVTEMVASEEMKKDLEALPGQMMLAVQNPPLFVAFIISVLVRRIMKDVNTQRGI